MKHPTLTVQSLGGVPNPEKGISLTGSTHFLTYDVITHEQRQQLRILLDMGGYADGDNNWQLFQEKLDQIGDLNKLDAVVISHVHNDHIGQLVYLVKQGYKGPIYMSAISKQMMRAILRDIKMLLDKDREQINKKYNNDTKPYKTIIGKYNSQKKRTGTKNHARTTDDEKISQSDYLHAVAQRNALEQAYNAQKEQFFDEKDIEQVMKQIIPLNLEQPTTIASTSGVNLEAKMYEAGHVEGAVQTVLSLDYDPEHQTAPYNVLYTGDLGRIDQPLLLDTPAPISEPVDLTIIESTYGNREHIDRIPEITRFLTSINTAHDAVVIPVFSLGRSMDILSLLIDAIKSKKLSLHPNEKIYIHSALAQELSSILRRENPQRYDFLAHPCIQWIDKDQEEEISKKEGRKIILAGGGMLQGGPAVSWTERIMNNDKARLLIVGFQSKNNWGAYLSTYQPQRNVYTFEPFKKKRHYLYDRDKLMSRKKDDTTLFVAHTPMEVAEILSHIYQDAIELADNEYIYIAPEFFGKKLQPTRTVSGSPTFYQYLDAFEAWFPEVFAQLRHKIKIISDPIDDFTRDERLADYKGIVLAYDYKGKKRFNAGYEAFKSFSGHADKNELMAHLARNDQKENHMTLLVHGDEEARSNLATEIYNHPHITGKVYIPALYETLVFECNHENRMFSQDIPTQK